MVGAVNDFDLEVNQRIACENAGSGSFTDTLFDRLDEFFRNRTADDLVFDHDTCAAFHGADVQHAMTVLTATAGLTDELGVVGSGLEERFTVGNFRLTGVGFDLEFTNETVKDDFQVEFTHTGDDGLPGFRVTLDREGRVFIGESTESCVEFITVRSGLGFDSDGDNRIGEGHGFENDLVVFVTEGITRGGVLQTHQTGDVTAQHFVQFFTGVRVHLEKTAETFFPAGSRVDDGSALLSDTGVDTDEGQTTHKRVGHDLEDESREGFIVAAVAHLGFFRDGVHTLGFPDIDRGRQEVADRVEEELNALVLERGTAESGDQLTGEDSLTEGDADLICIGHFAFQIHFSDVIVHIRQVFDEGFVVFVGKIHHVFGNVIFLHIGTVGTVVAVCLHVDDLNIAFKGFSSADGERNGNDFGAQFLLHISNDFVEVSTGTVHLVDERHHGDFVLHRLTPDGFRLRLNAADGAVNSDRTVENAERTFHFSSEVHVTRGVDQIETVLDTGSFVIPEASGCSGGNGDTTFLFLRHPVHRGSTFVGFPELVVFAGVVQDTFGKGGLAGVDVRHDTDIPVIGERGTAAGSFLVVFVQFMSHRALPSVMSEGLVGLSHLVSIIFLFDGCAGVIERFEDFACESIHHAAALLALRVGHDPADRESDLAVSRDFQGDLIGGTTDAAGFDFEFGLDIFDGLDKDFQGFHVFFLGADDIESAIDDLLCNGLFTAAHQHVDEACDEFAVELDIGRKFPFCDSASSHCSYVTLALSYFFLPLPASPPLACFAPYLERPCLRPSTPRLSRAPLTT